MPKLRPPLLASEPDEDDLGREGEHSPLGGLTIMVAMHNPQRGHDPRLADETKDDGDSDSDSKGVEIPRMSKAELDARIRACQCQLDCLKALRSGDHDAVRRHTAALVQADADLERLNGDKESDDGEQ
jgi:hypothetical protein